MAARGESKDAPRPQKVTKHDAEFAKHRADLARVEGRAEWTRIVAMGFSFALVALACTVPLLALREVIEPLAGKNTNINANLILGGGFTISVSINVFQIIKNRTQRSDIKKLRARADGLEAQLGLKGGS